MAGQAVQGHPTPSCQGEHHRGLACWLRGDGKLGGSVDSVAATSFSEGAEVRCSCYSENTDTENKLLCTQACEQRVRKLEAQQDTVPQSQRGSPFAICYRHVRGGKKGQFCNLEGERKESSRQNSLSLARNSLSAALLTALKLWGLGGMCEPGVDPRPPGTLSEGVVCKQPMWNAWGCKRKVISGSTEL